MRITLRVCPECQLEYHDRSPVCLVDGTALEEVDDPRIGMVLAGRYVLESVLGEGGMATVYKARHTLIDRPCAVKVMHHALSQVEGLPERFGREAKSASALAHPNILEIFDQGVTEEGDPYIVMELLEGKTLRERIDEGPLPPHDVLKLGLQIATGLARAHDLDVVHRDLKPENLILLDGPEGEPLVKLVDFGLAKANDDLTITHTGEVVGTPPYLAPERLRDAPLSPSCDLYALGVVFFEMATGRRPFEAENIAGYVYAHLNVDPPRPSSLSPSIPPGLEGLILELLAKDPEARPVDAHQVARRLEAMLPEKDRGPKRKRVASRAMTYHEAGSSAEVNRWEIRLATFETRLRQAYGDDAPADLERTLAELREAVTELAQLSAASLEAQRILEEIEVEAQEGRERLGHAVQALGEDLSLARQEKKKAESNRERAQERASAARARWVEHDARLDPLRRGKVSVPDAAMGEAARIAGQALVSWAAARRELEEDDRRLDRARHTIDDLEYQIGMLRTQLARHEHDFELRAHASRERLRVEGDERRSLEMRIIGLSQRFCEPLSRHAELRDALSHLADPA